jgi:hypothetical protein
MGTVQRLSFSLCLLTLYRMNLKTRLFQSAIVAENVWNTKVTKRTMAIGINGVATVVCRSSARDYQRGRKEILQRATRRNLDEPDPSNRPRKLQSTVSSVMGNGITMLLTLFLCISTVVLTLLQHNQSGLDPSCLGQLLWLFQRKT